MSKNILLLSLVNANLGEDQKTSRENYAYFCPKCNHNKRKLEVDFKDNPHGNNPWQCYVFNKILQIKQKNQSKSSFLIKKERIYKKAKSCSQMKTLKDWQVGMHDPESRPFFMMDYKKHYWLLIGKALNRTIPDCYTEKHHIIPKCMGGTDESINLVTLTSREHFVAHWLLHRAHPYHDGLAHAFETMTRFKGRGKVRYTPSSRDVAEAKEAKAVASKKLMTENNPMKHPELRELQRQRNLGDGNFWNRLSAESKEKHRESVRASKIGANNPKAVKVEFVATGVIYGSIAECYRAENLKGNHLYLEKENIIKRL